MNPHKTRIDDGQIEAPSIEEQDWDALKGAKIPPDTISEDDGGASSIEKDRDLAEEDDDNAYQNSDDALPDDEEERAISRDPSREGGRFDED
ncbi:hypothetical protein [Mesorhizobium sp. INR15]|uniref:hypothetical protein n=1 Tax=Mesorhizobium sp. INR15 TaxID=2654248 RepID=UPI00189679A5|nr:hypothetical protein GA829_13740 [Mesorhizobium sp. INR15]